MADVQTSEVAANFHQSTWDHETLYADISSEAEQLLIRPILLWKTKNTNLAGSCNSKLTFCFVETAHQTLHLDKRSLVK
jgi:hypothetical protein